MFEDKEDALIAFQDFIREVEKVWSLHQVILCLFNVNHTYFLVKKVNSSQNLFPNKYHNEKLFCVWQIWPMQVIEWHGWFT